MSTLSAAFPSPQRYRSAKFLVNLWRAALGAVLVIALNQFSSLGTNITLVIVGTTAATFLGSRLAFSTLKPLGFFVFLGGLLFAYVGSEYGTDALAPAFIGGNSLAARLFAHSTTILLFSTLAFVSAWLFWKYRTTPTLELLALVTLFISVLAGHRNFNFDKPRIVNNLAWQFSVEPIVVIIVFGSLILVTALVYAFVSSHVVRPHEQLVIRTGRSNIFLTFIFLTVLASLFSAVGIYMYKQKPPVNNGVGDKELNFPPGAGRSSQPAAIVRLEGDYKENPWSPMLYLRESAFSKLVGNKLAFAGRSFDADITETSPKQAFQGKESADLQMRTPLTQSVYMIVSQENAFAVDYPISIVQLKNPRPDRFKASYRAYSMAPAFPLSEIQDAEVGDPNWAPEVKRHYLIPHVDPRYGQLAKDITKDIQAPVKKATAIAQYLSLSSIYTLTPNHPTPEGGDETSAFLFGDKRGFCIHFAHATVFMLRALGIPARIGSGYLTDLSQSKDGHILLRISDRHAWAEVYVTNYGWLPFDTQPQQVENHADTPVDKNLLDELMGMLDPGEEILPADEKQEKSTFELPKEFPLPSKQSLLIAAFSILSLMIAWKLYLRYAWMLPGSSKQLLIKRGYTAIASRLWDFGLSREQAETRLEYLTRIRRSSQITFEPPTLAALNLKYSEPDISAFDPQRYRAAVRESLASFQSQPLYRRILAFFNPYSLFSSFFRGGW